MNRPGMNGYRTPASKKKMKEEKKEVRNDIFTSGGSYHITDALLSERLRKTASVLPSRSPRSVAVLSKK